MESFDQSLKCLLQHEPEDFIRLGLGDLAVKVVRPISSDLPARGRVVDGGYLVEPTVRERIQALDSDEMLASWYEEALEAVDSSAARKLVGKITGAC